MRESEEGDVEPPASSLPAGGHAELVADTLKPRTRLVGLDIKRLIIRVTNKSLRNFKQTLTNLKNNNYENSTLIFFSIKKFIANA